MKKSLETPGTHFEHDSDLADRRQLCRRLGLAAMTTDRWVGVMRRFIQAEFEPQLRFNQSYRNKQKRLCCRVWSACFVVIVSARAARPTVFTSTRLTRAHGAWLGAGSASGGAGSALTATADTCPDRQEAAALLCRQVWTRHEHGGCDMPQVCAALRIALRSGVPELVRDVAERLLLTADYHIFSDDMADTTVDLLAGACGSIGDSAQQALARAIQSQPIACCNLCQLTSLPDIRSCKLLKVPACIGRSGACVSHTCCSQVPFAGTPIVERFCAAVPALSEAVLEATLLNRLTNMWKWGCLNGILKNLADLLEPCDEAPGRPARLLAALGAHLSQALEGTARGQLKPLVDVLMWARALNGFGTPAEQAYAASLSLELALQVRSLALYRCAQSRRSHANNTAIHTWRAERVAVSAQTLAPAAMPLICQATSNT